MDFSVHDRLVLLSFLAAFQGNLTTVRAVRDMQQELGFSDDELEALNFQQGAEGLKWDTAADVAKAVDISDARRRIIAAQIAALDAKGALTVEHLPVVERFTEV